MFSAIAKFIMAIVGWILYAWDALISLIVIFGQLAIAMLIVYFLFQFAMHYLNKEENE